jgi:electron transfer flavoprotein beta subunit
LSCFDEIFPVILHPLTKQHNLFYTLKKTNTYLIAGLCEKSCDFLYRCLNLFTVLVFCAINVAISIKTTTFAGLFKKVRILLNIESQKQGTLKNKKNNISAKLNLSNYQKMSLKIVVLAKQVPDTRNVGKDAMKADGTVNRAALPAIYNPEDLNALEQALRLKSKIEGTTVHVLTMGPVRAAEIIRESMYRGADGGYLLSGREFAGSDTLATSYALACSIRKLGKVDLIICGRQAIDGDTAQVGPQIAEKLGLPQITYAEEILDLTGNKITVKRRLERGIEVVRGPLPMLITVNGSAPECRPRHAKLTMKYKRAATPSEKQETGNDYTDFYDTHPDLNIVEWGANDIEHDIHWLGLSGSPTKVKQIENVVFTAKESKRLTSSDFEIESLMKELIANHTIG